VRPIGKIGGNLPRSCTSEDEGYELEGIVGMSTLEEKCRKRKEIQNGKQMALHPDFQQHLQVAFPL